jgi:hypothetical protein
MSDALLGHTGFVGGTLKRQRSFDALFDSRTIAMAGDAPRELVVCAAAPAQKWLANRDPEADRAGLQRLMDALSRLRCRRFVLVSTVDVFADPNGADESTAAPLDGLQPYGRHRRELELFVAARFPGALIARLPALVGPELRKNALHDLQHDHEVGKIDSRASFQFYPMVNLWADLRLALDLELPLVHFATQPLSIAEVAREALGQPFDHVPDADSTPPFYDFRSRHATAFGGTGGYLYGRREVLLAVRAYAQSEPARPQP